jgi:oligopeptidase B
VDRVDDYAWLASAEDPDVLAYLRAERSHYDAATAHLGSSRLGLTRELTRRTPLAERSVSWRRGGLVYYTVTAQGEQYEKIYRRDIHSEQDLLVLDPNQLAQGRPYLELGLVEPSPDGRLLAYSIDVTGSELYELRFRDLQTGRDRPDLVQRSYYGGAWSADSGSFFYTVPDAAYRPDRVLRHVLGTPSASDQVVVTEPDRRFELELAASRDGGWVLITARSRDTTEVRLIRAADPQEAPRLVCPRRPGVEYTVEPLSGDTLLVVTDLDAPDFRLLEAPVPAPGQAGDATSWQPVPGPGAAAGERLEFAAAFAGHVVLGLRRDVEPFLRVLSRSPEGGPAPFEVHSSVPFGRLELWRAEEFDTATIIVVEQNLVSPPVWFEVALDSGERRELKRTEVPGADLSRYATRRIEAPAPDGTLVPVTLAFRADLVAEPGSPAGQDDQRPAERAPALLYGYGAYEACSWPTFEVGPLSLLDRGVVYAVAHVRGGGERGRGWWQDGRLRRKQHTFDDFVAARDALVEQGWVDGARVASRGLSAGGLLQGAVFSQAPDRWRAVVAEVPFVDVVTTMSDPEIPLTINEWDEWGDPRDAGDFAAMLAYSPYDHPPAPPRPALLVTGALNDPRVLVHEPAKWVARLRATDPDGDPARLLLRVELGQGAHVGPSGRFAHLAYEAEILAWILAQLDPQDAVSV